MNTTNLIAASAAAILSSLTLTGQEFITYEQFGAVGDGKHDDLQAIIDAHNEANRKGLPVKATDGRTYYIGGGAGTAVIKTDTDWGKAGFIIDDVDTENYKSYVFTVSPSEKPYRIDNIRTLGKGQKKLTARFPSRILVKVENAGKKVYIRKGLNRNNGHTQQEMLVVERNGAITPESRPIFEYEQVTKATAYPIDANTLTVKGGVFTTIANRQPSKYKYYGRGIKIKRSNVVVEGIVHYVKGELDHGAPYRGFIVTEDAADVVIRDCILTGRKMYGTIGSAGKPVNMGSYDLSLGTSVNVSMENITQTNDINDRTWWGLMGSNWCKDLRLTGCRISRFDAHQGVENVTLKDCTFGHMGVRMVGCGTILMENCTVNTNYLVSLRNDYGSSWEGDIVVRNCTMKPQDPKLKDIVILTGSNNGDHDFGYECMLPRTIDVDGLKIEDGILKSSAYKGPMVFSTFGRDVTKPGLEPYKVTRKVILRNVTTRSGKDFSAVSANAAMFNDVKIVK